MQVVDPATRGSDRGGMARAFATGVVLTLVLAVVAWLLGVVGPAHEGWLFGGVGLAIGAGGVALWLNGLFLAVGKDGDPAAAAAVLAGRLQALLAAAFGVKLAVIAVAVIVLQQAGVKFAATAVFCLTFVAASLVCQLTTAVMLARSLDRRKAGSPTPRNPS